MKLHDVLHSLPSVLSLTLFGPGGGGGGFGLLPGFSSITQKPFKRSSPNFVTLVIHI